MKNLIAVTLLVAAMATSASAQVLQNAAKRNDTNGPIGTAVSPLVNPFAKTGDAVLTGDPIADLHSAIQRGGAKLILHLKQSYAIASSTNASGSADKTSANCTRALVPIVDLVVNGPKADTVPAGDPMAMTPEEVAMVSTSEPEGIIVKVEKLRILRLTLTSPALNDACGALVQDEVKNAQNLIGKITSLITGAGLAGITGGLIP